MYPSGRAMRSRCLLRLPAVLGVGDVRPPLRLWFLGWRDAFGQGEVGHEVVGCGAVPVPLLRGCVDDVAGTDADDAAAAGLHKSCSFGDIEGLAERVGVPCGARAWREMDG